MRYIHPVTDTLKAMLAMGWTIDTDDARHHESSMDRKQMRRPTLVVSEASSWVIGFRKGYCLCRVLDLIPPMYKEKLR